MSGKYIYAIVSAGTFAKSREKGIGGAPLRGIEEDGIVAVVSTFDGRSVRPERRNIAAHQKTLNGIMRNTTPLPMSFGIVADNEGAVRTLLREHHEEFATGLARVRDKVEMGLKVRWDVANIFEYFVNTHPSLQALRDAVFAGDRDASQDDKLELGRRFDQLLSADREQFSTQVENVLEDYCSEICRTKLRGETEVMNLACLVDKDAQDEFEKGVFKAAEAFDNNYAFDFNGPWAPYNFVDVRISL